MARYAEVLKFNAHHDAQGRFSSGDDELVSMRIGGTDKVNPTAALGHTIDYEKAGVGPNNNKHKTNPRQLGGDLAGVSGVLHDKIPLQTIFDHANRAGYIPVQEDGTPWEGMLLGAQGRAIIELKNRYTDKVDNAIALQWYKHERTGRYEVNAYTTGNPYPRGAKKDDLTNLDGVPVKNPELAPHRKRRYIQGLPE